MRARRGRRGRVTSSSCNDDGISGSDCGCGDCGGRLLSVQPLREGGGGRNGVGGRGDGVGEEHAGGAEAVGDEVSMAAGTGAADEEGACCWVGLSFGLLSPLDPEEEPCGLGSCCCCKCWRCGMLGGGCRWWRMFVLGEGSPGE